MQMQKLHSVLSVRDMAAAEAGWTRLFGRGPDNRPMATPVQWELTEGGAVGIGSDAMIVRRGAIIPVVDDIAAERARLEAAGIAVGPDAQGDHSTLAQITDPDGNLITLASPPSPPCPAA